MKNVMFMALLILIFDSSLANAYSRFSEKYFIRRQAELAHIIKTAQTFKSGETYTYSQYVISNEYAIVTILEANQTTVHYKEKLLAYKIVNTEGWLDVKTGQTIQKIENGQVAEVTPYPNLSLFVIDTAKVISSPVGNVTAVHLGFDTNEGTMAATKEDIYISEDVKGLGILKRHGIRLGGEIYDTWVE